MTSIKCYAIILGLSLGAANVALAADARTTATASSGLAEATAQYSGHHGFARTDTRSGRLDLARGVAVGVDENGLSLSVSHAVRPNGGPAIATTFNLAIGPSGVAAGTGLALADGPLHARVSAGGVAGSSGLAPAAVASASGATDPAGRVIARTRSDNSRWSQTGHGLVAERWLTSQNHPADRGRIVETKRVAGRW